METRTSKNELNDQMDAELENRNNLDICHCQKLYPTEEVKEEFRTDSAIYEYLHLNGYGKVEIQGGYDRLTYIMVYVFEGTESEFLNTIDNIIN